MSGQGGRLGTFRDRLREPRTLPWRAPRHEVVLLLLVALAALAPVYRGTDGPRTCLAEAVLHGKLSNDACLTSSGDRASYGGHLYSDKAPGVGFLIAPAVAVLDPAAPGASPFRMWIVRLLSIGAAFLVIGFLIGRLTEGLAPGYGGVAIVALTLGTLLAPFAATTLDDVLAGAIGFGAFLLAWARRPGASGLLAGLAVIVNYEAGLIVAGLALLFAFGPRGQLGRYLLATLPGIALLGAYDWAAFGAPWRLSYKYVSNEFSDLQGGTIFGIGLPNRFALDQVFAGSGGLLVVSPVVLLAALGLVRLGRKYPLEALVAGLIGGAYVFVNAGYFLPYGGLSPGPRFLIPGLPFLAVGLGCAFRSWPRAAVLATVASVVPVMGLTLVWTSHGWLRGTIWGELARVPVQLGDSWVAQNLPETVFSHLTGSRAVGALVMAAAALAAVVVAVRSMPRPAPFRAVGLSRRSLVSGVLCVALVGVADVAAGFGYPYGHRTFARLPLLTTSISSTATVVPLGGEVDFVVTVRNGGSTDLSEVRLTLDLPSGVELLGPPAVERGSGCAGTARVVCTLGSLDAGMSTPVRLGVKVVGAGAQKVSAKVSSGINPGGNRVTVSVRAE